MSLSHHNTARYEDLVQIMVKIREVAALTKRADKDQLNLDQRHLGLSYLPRTLVILSSLYSFYPLICRALFHCQAQYSSIIRLDCQSHEP